MVDQIEHETKASWIRNGLSSLFVLWVCRILPKTERPLTKILLTQPLLPQAPLKSFQLLQRRPLAITSESLICWIWLCRFSDPHLLFYMAFISSTRTDCVCHYPPLVARFLAVFDFPHSPLSPWQLPPSFFSSLWYFPDCLGPPFNSCRDSLIGWFAYGLALRGPFIEDSCDSCWDGGYLHPWWFTAPTGTALRTTSPAAWLYLGSVRRTLPFYLQPLACLWCAPFGDIRHLNPRRYLVWSFQPNAQLSPHRYSPSYPSSLEK